jgi:hypothetical protein
LPYRVLYQQASTSCIGEITQTHPSAQQKKYTDI